MAELEPIGHQLVIVTFVFGFVTLSTLTVRVWFRLRQRKYDVSDTCLIAAMICAIVQSAIQLILVLKFDYGTVKADIPLELRTSAWPAKLSYINQIFFKITTPLSKLSLCLLYRAMCSTSTNLVIRVTRAAIWGTIILIVGAYGSAFLISIVQCMPVEKTWNKKIDGKCIDLTAFRMRVIITLPIPTLLKLRNHRPEVTQLLGLILLGLVHTGLTIARFVIMFYPDPITKTQPQYAHIMTNCLAVAEMDIGIWVATLVVMRPAFSALYRVFRPDGRTGLTTDGSYYGKSGKVGNSYAMNQYSGRSRSRKMEDEFHILETTDIQVVSEDAEGGKGTEHGSMSDVAKDDVERKGHGRRTMGYRGSVVTARDL